MICTFDQIKNIILNNPNKQNIDFGKQQTATLMRHVYGKDLKTALSQYKYFENSDVYQQRILNPTSNKDLFARLLQREEQVFSAHGGACYYTGLNPKQTQDLNKKLDNIRFGMTLRYWIKQFALQAYRCDPMGLIFIEVNEENIAYPTYKCISSIYDYKSTGRKIEYVCFRLNKADALAFGIVDPLLKNFPNDKATEYYRFVDDAFDSIYKVGKGNIILVPVNGKDQIQNEFHQTPAFIVSDMISFDNSSHFFSPLSLVIELAETYQNDRSIRDLQKKYAGFLKSVEPMLECGECHGTGQLSGSTCPSCNGTTYKLKTTVADVARIDWDTIAKIGDIKKAFAYISPDVTVWNKQDTSLNDIENMIVSVYWGTDLRANTINGPEVGAQNIEETATKTIANLQPIYARLNRTADWAQQTENMIIDFIGGYSFPEVFKQSSVTYGRYYILETPDTLMDEYLSMKKSGASQTSLTESLRKYYHSAYKENPAKLAIMLKLMNVEPFVNHTLVEVQAANPAKIDFVSKLYYNDWLLSQNEDTLLSTTVDLLKASLLDFAINKLKDMPESVTPPGVSISERAIS
jgi:hypothetical protein